MKKLVLISSLVVMSSLSPESSTDEVYICNSPYAKRYHLTLECKAFESCTHDIVKQTLDEAKKKGFTKCKIEK